MVCALFKLLLADDDGRISETWNSSREMELECWRTYHTYARRFRMLERLEKFGTIESETEDEEFSNDDSLNQKKQKVSHHPLER